MFFLIPGEVCSQDIKNENQILGTWLDEKGQSAIKIFKDNKSFSGKIIWMKNPYDANGNDVRDANNKNDKLKSRKLKNLVILTGLKYNGNGKWEEGEVYIPRIGETLQCEIEMISTDTLKVNAHYAISKIGRTVKWTRFW